MKYLFEAERGKVIREPEILKTYFTEQDDDKTKIDFEIYEILPNNKNYPKILVGIKNNRMYSLVGTSKNYSLGNEIGFENVDLLNAELTKTIKRKGKKIVINTSLADAKYKNGIDYVFEILSKSGPNPSLLTNENGGIDYTELFRQVTEYSAQKPPKIYGFGFSFEIKVSGILYDNIKIITPFLYGFTMNYDTLTGSGSIRNDVTRKYVEFEDFEITTPPPPPIVPEELKLDLKDVFFYDCPGKVGCGKKGGSNTDPLRDKAVYKKISDFAEIINTYYKDSKPIYVLGFASVEGDIQHNLELSQNRANFVSDLIKQKIKNPKIKIIPIGKGETSFFKSGSTEQDYIPNRRVIVTTDENSREPFIFSFKK